MRESERPRGRLRRPVEKSAALRELRKRLPEHRQCLGLLQCRHVQLCLQSRHEGLRQRALRAAQRHELRMQRSELHPSGRWQLVQREHGYVRLQHGRRVPSRAMLRRQRVLRRRTFVRNGIEQRVRFDMRHVLQWRKLRGAPVHVREQ